MPQTTTIQTFNALTATLDQATAWSRTVRDRRASLAAKAQRMLIAFDHLPSERQVAIMAGIRAAATAATSSAAGVAPMIAAARQLDLEGSHDAHALRQVADAAVRHVSTCLLLATELQSELDRLAVS